jgi:hypothetical protein
MSIEHYIVKREEFLVFSFLFFEWIGMPTKIAI